MFRLGALVISALLIAAVQFSAPALSNPTIVGPDKCQNCHKAPHGVWKDTKHSKSYKKIHKHKTAKKIVKAVGEKRMKKSAICANCHYTVVEKKKGKPKPIAGPACESCHGAASKWIAIHNDKGVDKATRRANAAAAGMVRPDNLYDIAANCMSCHGLENENLSGEHASAMLENGHPLNPNFEVVEYSQGSVRHRFYPPDVTKNKEMTKPEMSRFFVIGQAAALVSANNAVLKTQHAKYVEGQNKRIARAIEILGNVPDAAQFLANPSRDTGRALADAIKAKDLTSIVGNELPSSYK